MTGFISGVPLLELLSHEFFHAWNGKRIAPKPLLDFDYSTEAYTPRR